MTMTTDEVMTLAIRALVDCGSLSPAARDMAPADALHQWAESNALDPETFTCGCGDVDHPMDSGDDESIWCECGLRIAEQRAAARMRAGVDRVSAHLSSTLFPPSMRGAL